MFEATTYNEFVVRGILVRVSHMFSGGCRHNKAHSGALKPWTVSQTCQHVLECVCVCVCVCGYKFAVLQRQRIRKEETCIPYSGESQETQCEFKITTFISA
jgi:hypothetical protein